MFKIFEVGYVCFRGSRYRNRRLDVRIQQFEEIDAWKMGRQLSVLVYSISGRGEFGRDFGLKDQIRRAAGSVMHNIAEGLRRRVQS